MKKIMIAAAVLAALTACNKTLIEGPMPDSEYGYINFGLSSDIEIVDTKAATTVEKNNSTYNVYLKKDGAYQWSSNYKEYSEITEADLKAFLYDQNPLADYLARNTVQHMYERKNAGPIWSKPLWDVTAIGWLLNDNERYMRYYEQPVRLPEYNGRYGKPGEKIIKYVYAINRDVLMTHLIQTLTE